jgi:hypothetical protein
LAAAWGFRCFLSGLFFVRERVTDLEEKQFLQALRARIVAAADQSTYDHRPFMIPEVVQKFPHMSDEEQLQYSRFKLAVARILQPYTIYEVGVGWGVSAQAFLEGYPDTKFFGIDNMAMGVDPNRAVLYNPLLPCRVVDSADLDEFVHPDGPIDLLHIDGGHALEHKADDMVRAFKSKPEWILIDDCHDVMVAAGVFAGIYRAGRNALSMMYFENSHTGNLLIHAKRREPEFRGLECKRV